MRLLFRKIQIALYLIGISFVAIANKQPTQKIAKGFIENKGQILKQNNVENMDVLFLFTAGGYKIQLRKTGFSYELLSDNTTGKTFKPDRQELNLQELKSAQFLNYRVDLDFVGMNPDFTVVTSDQLPGITNYYLSGHQLNGLRSFSTVTYKNIFYNTDIEFVINETEQHFKYNLILHPGANLNTVKFLIKGASGLNLSNKGALVIETPLGTITDDIPFSYYANQSNKNEEVKFNLHENLLSFTANYDNSKTLIIDPSSNLIWGTYYGSPNIDFCTSNGTDSQNNVYIAGYTNSSANIATSGVFQSTLNASFDAYVVKFNAAGIRQWGSYVGGSGVDVFYAIWVEPAGTVYLCGDTSSQNGMTTSGVHQTTYGGGIDDAYLVKFSTNGQRLWSTYMGGNQHDIAQAIAVDSQSNVIISGHSESASAIASNGVYQMVYGLNYDVFISKFTPSGTRLWGTYYGDSGVDEAYGLATDNNDNILVTGGTQSFSGMTGGSPHQPVFGGTKDAFIAKFNPTGTSLIWGTYYGGALNDYGNDIETDNNGNIYVCGVTSSSTGISTSAAYQQNPGNADDSFLAAFNSNGVRQWGSYFGGEDTDYITDLLVDQNKYLLFCGSTLSNYSISVAGAYQPSIALINYYDAFFAKFTLGGAIQLASYYGGEGNDNARAIAMDGLGKIYLTGESTSTTGIATPGAFTTTNGGNTDAFTARFCIPFQAAFSPAGTSTICSRVSTLTANTSYSTYLWNNTFTTNPLVVNSTTAVGTYSFFLSVNDGFGCTGVSDTTYLVVQKCTSLLESENETGLVIYPNPVEKNLWISQQGLPGLVHYSLMDLYGKIVIQGEHHAANFELNTSTFAPGVYFLEAKTTQGSLVKKIIKH